jgi:alpha-tubulin suppressor-like RCC1 family protein
LALTNDNKVYSWGADPYGSLGKNKIETYVDGNGTLTWFWLKSFQKVNIPDELNVKAVYAGPSWARLILTVEGDVYWFGRNNAASRVGGNSFASEDSCAMGRVDCAPIKATTLSNIEKIAMGNAHTLFLDKNGKVFSVGNNGYGQLGNGTVTSNYRIIEVKDLPLIKEIGAGDFSSYAISVDGKVYSWGDNRYGQLGLKDLNQRNSPILTNITSGAKLVDGGTKNALIIKDDGQMLLTGSDEFGQLGLAQSPSNNEPTELIFPPNLTFTTANNQIKEVGETIVISGDVFLSTTGKEVDITYTLDN